MSGKDTKSEPSTPVTPAMPPPPPAAAPAVTHEDVAAAIKAVATGQVPSKFPEVKSTEIAKAGKAELSVLLGAEAVNNLVLALQHMNKAARFVVDKTLDCVTHRILIKMIGPNHFIPIGETYKNQTREFRVVAWYFVLLAGVNFLTRNTVASRPFPPASLFPKTARFGNVYCLAWQTLCVNAEVVRDKRNSNNKKMERDIISDAEASLSVGCSKELLESIYAVADMVEKVMSEGKLFLLKPKLPSIIFLATAVAEQEIDALAFNLVDCYQEECYTNNKDAFDKNIHIEIHKCCTPPTLMWKYGLAVEKVVAMAQTLCDKTGVSDIAIAHPPTDKFSPMTAARFVDHEFSARCRYLSIDKEKVCTNNKNYVMACFEAELVSGKPPNVVRDEFRRTLNDALREMVTITTIATAAAAAATGTEDREKDKNEYIELARIWGSLVQIKE